jgi:hypothetical protein
MSFLLNGAFESVISGSRFCRDPQADGLEILRVLPRDKAYR